MDKLIHYHLDLDEKGNILIPAKDAGERVAKIISWIPKTYKVIAAPFELKYSKENNTLYWIYKVGYISCELLDKFAELIKRNIPDNMTFKPTTIDITTDKNDFIFHLNCKDYSEKEIKSWIESGLL